MTNNKLTDEQLTQIYATAREARLPVVWTAKRALAHFKSWITPEKVEFIAAELQERRKADNQEPAGYHVIKECGRVGCSVATLEEAEKTRDFWNKKWTIRPYFYSAAPAPVVPEEMPAGLAGQIVSLLAHNIGDKFLAQKIWNACRAALLQGSQPVSNCDELQVIGWLRSDYNSDDKRDPNAPLFMLGRNDPSETWGVKYIPLSGNSPVIPGGWISCGERMPDREYVLAGDFSGTHYLASIPNVQVGIYADWFDDEKPCWDDGDGNDLHLKEVTHWMPLPEPPQEVK